MMWSRGNDGNEQRAERERREKHSADTWQARLCVCVCARALPGNYAKVQLRKNRNRKNRKLHWPNLDKPAPDEKKTTRKQTVWLFIAAINKNR